MYLLASNKKISPVEIEWKSDEQKWNYLSIILKHQLKIVFDCMINTTIIDTYLRSDDDRLLITIPSFKSIGIDIDDIEFETKIKEKHTSLSRDYISKFIRYIMSLMTVSKTNIEDQINNWIDLFVENNKF